MEKSGHHKLKAITKPPSKIPTLFYRSQPVKIVEKPSMLSRMRFPSKNLVLASIIPVIACVENRADCPDTAIEQSAGFTLGPQQICAFTDTLGFDRFTSQASARGLEKPINPNLSETPGVLHTPFLAEDLDGDGDIDLAFNRPTTVAAVFENDGNGYFTEIVQNSSSADLPQGRIFLNVAAADMNGDALPDLVFSGSGMVMLSTNLGDLQFDEPKALFFIPSQPYTSFQSFHLGDVDADQDLDILLAGTAVIEAGSDHQGEPQAGPELLLLNIDGQFELEATLTPDGGAGFSMLSLITDYDNDGDQDLQTFTDLGRRTPSNFYRNDGLGGETSIHWVEEAEPLRADLHLSAMGITTGDYNRDGRLDYCMSDIGPAKCLLSAPDGSFIESGVAMGLVPDLMADIESWAGWSMEIEDLDNDGFEDAVSAAGLDMRGELPAEQPNAIWQGVDIGKFEDRSVALGFADEESHYALVSADFDGDGFLDILTIGAETAPILWMNQCDNQSWLEVELVGPHKNKGGFGVRVQVDAGGQSQLREIQNLRGLAQGPSRAHFGLGPAQTIDQLSLFWPDGTTDILKAFSPNRVVEFNLEHRP
jgi:hypothetical protein